MSFSSSDSSSNGRKKKKKRRKREEKVKRVRLPAKRRDQKVKDRKRRAKKVAKKSSKFQGFRRLPEISRTVNKEFIQKYLVFSLYLKFGFVSRLLFCCLLSLNVLQNFFSKNKKSNKIDFIEPKKYIIF
jgi:hypothetical protein